MSASRLSTQFGAAILLSLPLSISAQQTVAERSGGMKTSSHAEVLEFIDSLKARKAPMHVGTLGRSPQGKVLPYLVLSNPQVTTPQQAKSSGKPILYIQGNIHAGEVEGKEAIMALTRDLTLGSLRPLRDSVVIIFVPIYNADGNDQWGRYMVQRSSQIGPLMVGVRPNGQGYDLNRDYVKQEAPETRASFELINQWDPDLFMDLHTTNGSYHGYALTYSPSLNPNRSPANAWVEDTVLEAIRLRMRQRHGFEIYPYGNFDGGNSQPSGYRTYESLPRYGSNLMGITRLSILSEAMSHDSFPRRIASTYAFVLETIRYLNEHRSEARARMVQTAVWRPDSVVIRGNGNAAMAMRMDTVLVAVTRTGEIPLNERADSAARADALRSPAITNIIGCSAATAPGAGGAAGMGGRAGAGGRMGAGGAGFPGRGAGAGGRGAASTRVELTGQSYPVYMEVRDRFLPLRKEAVPAAYVFGPSYAPVVELLRRQGIVVEKTTAAWTGQLGNFQVDSLVSQRYDGSQGHCAVQVEGGWAASANGTIPVGSYLVSTNQRFGLLASFLLEPASEDGYFYWNFFDAGLKAGSVAPVQRLLSLPNVARVKLP